MYDELCELYKQQKQIFVKMNNCCLKKDFNGWADSIDEFNHLNRKIDKQLKDMRVLRNKNIDEQKKQWDKYFGIGEEKQNDI